MLKIDILDIVLGPVGVVMLGPEAAVKKNFFHRKP